MLSLLSENNINKLGAASACLVTHSVSDYCTHTTHTIAVIVNAVIHSKTLGVEIRWAPPRLYGISVHASRWRGLTNASIQTRKGCNLDVASPNCPSPDSQIANTLELPQQWQS